MMWAQEPVALKPKSKAEVVKVWRGMTVAELAQALGKDAGQLICN